MNKAIEETLSLLVPILRLNGENVKFIHVVKDYFWEQNREYVKEVAEIQYDNGTCRYADVGGDSNLTACYDVLAVILQIKKESTKIERLEPIEEKES